MAMKERKAALRKRIAQDLQKLESEEIERQSTMIVNKVLQMPAYQEAQSLAIFLSMPGREVSTRGIVLHALDHGKSIFIPYLHPGKIPKSKVMDMLQLRSKEDFHALQPDAWGIPSLSKDSVDTRKNALGGYGVSDVSSTDRRRTPVLDLVFMPAVAFDQSYNRLGHGKGFYDRYLARYKIALHSSQTARPMPRLVGIALDQQILSWGEIIPADEHDWTVDEVVSANR